MLFSSRRFFQKMNKQIRFLCLTVLKNEFICSIFGRIREYQKVLPKYPTFKCVLLFSANFLIFVGNVFGNKCIKEFHTEAGLEVCLLKKAKLFFLQFITNRSKRFDCLIESVNSCEMIIIYRILKHNILQDSIAIIK